jgi:hypothetical protein
LVFAGTFGGALAAGQMHAAVERPLMPDPKLPVDEGVAMSAQSSPSQPARATVIDSPAPAPQPLHLWLHRSSVFLFVLISAVAGVLLVMLPWTPEWTDNYLLLSYPSLRTLISTGFCRGLCSGLGLLDIWIGFWEALHYQEHQ